ncbi:hypothetical protein, partial [Massilia brevitalea]|uniref:hypothetical protein n=1 Tax=Massilia brevitalea TaxID=442526 RepID=UPI00273A4414
NLLLAKRVESIDTVEPALPMTPLVCCRMRFMIRQKKRRPEGRRCHASKRSADQASGLLIAMIQ